MSPAQRDGICEIHSMADNFYVAAVEGSSSST
jgi:hypothetical protein